MPVERRSEPREPDAVVDEAQPVAPPHDAREALTADGSVAVVNVTPLGHIRAVQGNPRLVAGLQIKANFPDVLAGQVGQALDGLLDAPRARTLALKDGRALALDVRPNVAGAQIASLNVGRIRRKKELLAASLLGGLNRHDLPEHAPNPFLELTSFDAAVLSEHRAA